MNTRSDDDISDNIVDELIKQYDTTTTPFNENCDNETISPSDPTADNHGKFSDYGKKKQINLKNMEEAYYSDEHDSRDFSYKKKAFVRKSSKDIKDQFDVDKLLPQEEELEWFDDPLRKTKKINGHNWIHPKNHMGVNTVGSSMRNATHDIRGDVPCPKVYTSVWNESTIEPDHNIKGICSAI